MDIRAILHQIQQGASDRQTAKALKVNRRTVQQYRQWATEQGLLDGPLYIRNASGVRKGSNPDQ